MEVLLGLAILAAIALLASSKRFYAVRRTRWGAVLTTGGWVMVAVGWAIGPRGIGLITLEQLTVLQPLIVFCLGWVGVVVGMQAHRQLLKVLPPGAIKVSVIDALLSFVLVTAGVAALLMSWRWPWYAALPGALVLGVSSTGWSAEVRSLKRRGMWSDAPAGFVRAAAGISSLLAVIAYGFVIFNLWFDKGGAVVLAPSLIATIVGLAISLMIGIVMGLLGSWLTHVARNDEGEFLLVLLGLIAFSAGAAAAIGYAPLFVSMLIGALLVNMSGKPLERLRRVMIDAEQPVAMALMLVVGVLADLAIGWEGVLLVVLLLALRAVIKLGVIGRMVRRKVAVPGMRFAIAGLMRPNPLALAIVAGFAVSRYGRAGQSEFSGAQLLGVVIIVGLIGEIWPFVRRWTTSKAVELGQAEAPR